MVQYSISILPPLPMVGHFGSKRAYVSAIGQAQTHLFPLPPSFPPYRDRSNWPSQANPIIQKGIIFAVYICTKWSPEMYCFETPCQGYTSKLKQFPWAARFKYWLHSVALPSTLVSCPFNYFLLTPQIQLNFIFRSQVTGFWSQFSICFGYEIIKSPMHIIFLKVCHLLWFVILMLKGISSICAPNITFPVYTLAHIHACRERPFTPSNGFSVIFLSPPPVVDSKANTFLKT